MQAIKKTKKEKNNCEIPAAMSGHGIQYGDASHTVTDNHIV